MASEIITLACNGIYERHHSRIKICWKISLIGTISHIQSRKTDKRLQVCIPPNLYFLSIIHPQSPAFGRTKAQAGTGTTPDARHSLCATAARDKAEGGKKKKKDLAHATDGAEQDSESLMKASPLRGLISAGNVVTQDGPQGSPPSPLL